MRINLFIYYGAKIDKIDYENLTRKLGFEYLYQTVYSKGLTFRDAGEIGKNGVYIIGKEIHWETSDVFELKKINDQLLIRETNSPMYISDELEDDVRQKLLEIDITNKPNYYVFTSVDSSTEESFIGE